MQVAVVGGGIVRICSALALQEAGHNVTLIECDAPGQGTSSGNAGVISPWSFAPQAMPGLWKSIPSMLLRPFGPASVSAAHSLGYLPWLLRFLKETRPDRVRANAEAMQALCRDSVTLYRQLLAGSGHEGMVVDSIYMHAFRNPKGANINDLAYRLRIEKGAEVERIGADALRVIEPDLSPEFKAAILIKGQARARDPGKISAVLAEKMLRNGGTILQASVSALLRQDIGWRVMANGDALNFDRVVLASGAWSAKLLDPLGVTLPLAADRGYHV